MAQPEVQVDPNSAVYKIFHSLWGVYMSPMQLRSVEHIREFGVVSSGDSAYDSAMRAEKRYYLQTIAELVEHHKRGVPIRLEVAANSVKIYELIQQHLSDWAYAVKFSFNRRIDDEIINDLLAMEEFAGVIYPKAHIHSNKTAHIDSFAQRFLGISGVDMQNKYGLTRFRSRRSTELQSGSQNEQAPLPERESFEVVFKNRKMQCDPIFNRQTLKDND